MSTIARVSPLRIVPTAFGIGSFLVGATAFYTIELMGEIRLAELLLPALGLAALCTREGRAIFAERAFRWLAIALVVTLAGYMLTDWVRESRPDQYLRGWGRVGITLIDFIMLAALASQDRRNLWWWAAGFGAGAVLYFRLVLHWPLPIWKHGYAEYFTVGFAAFAYFLPPRVAAVGFATLGLMSMNWDFRVHGLVCFAIAAVLWLRGGPATTSRRRPRRVWPLAIALGAAVGLAQLATHITEDQFNKTRRSESDLGRIAGLKFAATAFVASPFIGYGSWGSSAALDAAYRDSAGGGAGNSVVVTGRASTSMAHSQLLQSLLEGGIAGGAFFAVLLAMLARHLSDLALRRPLDALTPFLLYYLFYGLWHVLMSPFAAPHRLQIAASAVVIVVLALEAARERAAYRRAPWNVRMARA